MTEPIIINSVDVSECEFFIKTDSQCRCLNENDDMKLNDSGHFIYASCEYNSNCYYKQLQCLQAKLINEKKQHSGTKGLLTSSNKELLKALESIDEKDKKILKLTLEFNKIYENILELGLKIITLENLIKELLKEITN